MGWFSDTWETLKTANGAKPILGLPMLAKACAAALVFVVTWAATSFGGGSLAPWLWGLAFLAFIFLFFFLWVVSYATSLRKATEPVVEISIDGDCVMTERIGATMAVIRHCGFKVTNISHTRIGGCEVKVISLLSDNGDNLLGYGKQRLQIRSQRLSNSTDGVFDLPPLGDEIVEIASLAEFGNNQPIIIAYSSSALDQPIVSNIIPRQLAPFTIEIEVLGAPTPSREQFMARINDEGHLVVGKNGTR
jgi:hypothetical protein